MFEIIEVGQNEAFDGFVLSRVFRILKNNGFTLVFGSWPSTHFEAFISFLYQ
ncbi:Uncharacterised protein [Vibrio cholerae]|nr:Uncharacterised protein [Vibrio cholerae]CSI38973.1 Uncharacterised protein [Vibrio cholerae]